LIDGTNGTSVGAEDEGGIFFTGLTGSASVSNSSISGASLTNVTVRNTSGTLDRLTFSEVQIGANSNLGGDGLLLQPDGSATIKVTVEDSRFTSARGDLFQMSIRTGGANDLVFQRNALSNNHPNIVSGGGGFTITSSGAATALTYNISDNTFRDAKGTNLVIDMDGASGTFTGTINNNTIGVQGATQAGSSQGNGIAIGGFLQGTSTHTVAVTNNRVYDYANNGILMTAGEATTLASPTGRLNATIQGNTVAEPIPGGAFNGIRVVMGTSSQSPSGPPHAYKACLTFGSTTAALKNTVVGSSTGGAPEIRLFPRFNTQVGVIGFTPTGSTTNDGPAMAAFLEANNTVTAGSAVGNNSSTNPYLGTCPP
jgi:large repetitive protein